jgi:hypothetical protein
MAGYWWLISGCARIPRSLKDLLGGLLEGGCLFFGSWQLVKVCRPFRIGHRHIGCSQRRPLIAFDWRRRRDEIGEPACDGSSDQDHRDYKSQTDHSCAFGRRIDQAWKCFSATSQGQERKYKSVPMEMDFYSICPFG